MKITDNHGTEFKEPVPQRGDVLRVDKKEYHLVAQHSTGVGNELIDLEDGTTWSEEAVPIGSPLSAYAEYLAFDYFVPQVELITSNKLELVIGG